MSDETAPDVNQDSPDALETTPEPDVDWRKRFEDTQAELTRRSQILNDEEALLAHIGEKFPDWLSSDESDEDFEDDEDLRDDNPAPQAQAPEDYDQVRAWVAQQQYEQDLRRLADGRELTGDAREAIEDWSRAGGHTPQSLEKAVNRWFKLFPPPEPEADTKPAKKKTAPVPAGGQAHTGVPDFSDMNENQINQWMVDRARALDSQT